MLDEQWRELGAADGVSAADSEACLDGSEPALLVDAA